MQRAVKQLMLPKKNYTNLLMLLITIHFSAVKLGAEPVSMYMHTVESYDLEVVFNVTAHSLTGKSSIVYTGESKEKIGFILNSNFDISTSSIGKTNIVLTKEDEFDPEKVFANYGRMGGINTDKVAFWTANIPAQYRKDRKIALKIEWTGILYVEPENREFSRESIALEVSGTIGQEGIFLSPSAYWYPYVPESPATYRLETRLPIGWNGVTAGSPKWHDEGEYAVVEHISNQPIDGLNFSANKYIVKSVDHNGVIVMTYMLPEEESLADGYIESSIGYIDRYSSQIAPYPFPKFAVVDNFLPSGYGMPGWTLLGSEVLRLPFIRFTSLGHEVLHNWFGNSMWVDYRGGNWCEGLTTYLADYAYKNEHDSSAGIEYRANALNDIVSYVDVEGEYPISEFTGRQNSRDRAIGYGKVMMVFHMLRGLMETRSPTLFDEIIREVYIENQWKALSWEQWQASIEASFGQSLDWLFDQYVKGKGIPEISIQNVQYDEYDSGWQANFEVHTMPDEAHYSYMLPVRHYLKDWSYDDVSVYIHNPIQKVRIVGGSEIRTIKLDPGFDILRVPYALSITISAFFGSKDGILVVSSSSPMKDSFLKAADGLKREGQMIVLDSEFTDEMKDHSIWIFGIDNKLWDSYQQPIKELSSSDSSSITLTVITIHPTNPKATIVRTACTEDADPVAGTRKLSHYGKYSYLKFEGDKNIEKGTLPFSGENPMNWFVVD